MRSAGTEFMYGSGWNVSSLRATPMNAVAVSGIRCRTAPSMPRPARSTGTTSGGSPIRTPWVGPSGVVRSTGSVRTERVAS